MYIYSSKLRRPHVLLTVVVNSVSPCSLTWRLGEHPSGCRRIRVSTNLGCDIMRLHCVSIVFDAIASARNVIIMNVIHDCVWEVTNTVQ